MATMHPQSEDRKLLAPLTPEELEAAGKKLAEAVEHHQELEADLKDWWAGQLQAKKARKEDVTEAAGVAVKLAETVSSGKEEKLVPCDWLYALTARLAFLVRRDTQELVAKRPLRDDELQTVLGEVLQEPTPEQLAEWQGVYNFGDDEPEPPKAEDLPDEEGEKADGEEDSDGDGDA